jgi:hypothetical protein
MYCRISLFYAWFVFIASIFIFIDRFFNFRTFLPGWIIAAKVFVCPVDTVSIIADIFNR